MTRPGNRELAPEELATLIGGELPSVLPLEGWRTVTVHCQGDAIGPSDRHEDLVKLELSFPPTKAAEPPCKRCRGSKVVPDFSQWDAYHGEPKPVPCPECTACTATALPHQSAPDRNGTRVTWNDKADGATPHGAAVEPAVERPYPPL